MSEPTDFWSDWFDGLASEIRERRDRQPTEQMPLAITPGPARMHDEIVTTPLLPLFDGEYW